MVGTIIGAATAAASALGGAISSAVKNNRADALAAEERSRNRQWYDMKSNEDYLSRSDAQAVLNKQRDLLNEQYKRARATNIVAGGTDESLALQQKNANEAMAETASNIAAQASAYKDAAEQQYRQADMAMGQQQIANTRQQASNISQAAGQGVSAGLNLIGSEIKQANN